MKYRRFTGWLVSVVLAAVVSANAVQKQPNVVVEVRLIHLFTTIV